MRTILYGLFLVTLTASVARGQDVQPPPNTAPPAYLASIEGNATIERDGQSLAAELNMPFVTGDRLRTADGRVQIAFPDGTAIEVAENSEVECISPTRVRLLTGTMDHVQLGVSASQSSSYLPPDLRMYGQALDQNGSWQYDAPYGYVWYPTVAPDWRPYYYGYWAPVPRYGYTWIGADMWAWPTHHYGRWGFASNRWFWIPGRTWGPAWVSWAGATDYVSWCPLGFDGRPVFALNYGRGNPWLGWTVLSRANFGTYRYYPYRFAVEPRRIPATTTFVARTAPPLPPAHIGRTNPNGDRAAAGIAVPRQSPLATRQAPVTIRPTPSAQQPAVAAEGRRIVPAPPTRVQTHYGMAVPSATRPAPNTAPASSMPPPATAAVPSAMPPAIPMYRTVPPGYRAPAQATPRVATPATEPRVAAPAAAPRAPASAAPAQSAPAQAAPAATPTHAAPQGGARGEAQPRAQGRGRAR